MDSSARVPIPNTEYREKPSYIEVLRRRNLYRATNANGYDANQTIKIPIDTGTPGSLLDFRSTRLEFDLHIQNSNPFVDFLNFDSCGAMGWMKEWRVMVNGNFVEKCESYHQCLNTYLQQQGINQDPECVFRSNMYDPADGAHRFTHMNFIKPCMVDSMGNPMYQNRMFNDSADCTHMYFGAAVSETGGASSEGAATLTTSTHLGIIQNDAVQAQGTVGIRNWSNMCNFPPLSSLRMGPYKSTTNNYASGLDTEGGLLPLGVIAESVLFNGSYTKYLQSIESGTAGTTSISSARNVAILGGGVYPCPASLWPLGQPAIPEQSTPITGRRWGDMVGFMSNFKNVPIGVEPRKGLLHYVTSYEYHNNVSAYSPYVQDTTFRVNGFILSGLLGILAERAFPSMLVGAGKMWIEIDIEDPKVFLQTLMDPCRRIPGTVRDFCPYRGVSDGKATNSTDTASTNSYVGTYLNLNGATIAQAGAYETLIYSYAAAQGQIIAGTGCTDVTADTAFLAAAGSGKLVTGIPLPQYVPCETPWLMKNYNQASSILINYCNERDACYGTYLRHAVAQTKRTQSGSQNVASSLFSYSGYDTTFRIENVVLWADEIVLPANYATAILSHAQNGQIAYSTTMIRSSRVNAPQLTSQNLTLAVQSSSLRKLTLLFQSAAQIYGTQQMLYNSFATYNPFVSCNFTPGKIGSTTFDVGGEYSLNGVVTSKNSLGWNLFLQINQSYFPRTPINSYTELVMEYEKGVETIGLPGARSICKAELQRCTADSAYLEINPFKDDFFGCFVSIDALDDQTITGNPYFNIVELDAISAKTSVRGLRYPAAYNATNSYQPYNDNKSFGGVLNKYKPIDGKFQMVFLFDKVLRGSGVATSGVPVQQSVVTLNANNMYFATHTAAQTAQSMVVTTVQEMDAKVIFTGLGQITTKF